MSVIPLNTGQVKNFNDRIADVEEHIQTLEESYNATAGGIGNAVYDGGEVVVGLQTVAEINTQLADIAYQNVDSFGAKGDNTTDDTAAVQNAINSGNIRFSRKTYKVLGDINIPSDRTIIVPKGCVINSSGRFTAYDQNNVHWVIDGEIIQEVVSVASAKSGWPNTAEGTQAGNERGFIEFGGSVFGGNNVRGFSVTGSGTVKGLWNGTPNVSDLANQLNKKGIASWNCSDVYINIKDVSGFEGENVYHFSRSTDCENVIFEKVTVTNARFNSLNINSLHSGKNCAIKDCVSINCYQLESSAGDLIRNKTYSAVKHGFYFGHGHGGDNRLVMDNESYNCLGDIDFDLEYNKDYESLGYVKNITVKGNKSIGSVGTPFVFNSINGLEVESNVAVDPVSPVNCFKYYNIKNHNIKNNKVVGTTGTINDIAQLLSSSEFIGGKKAVKTSYGDRENRQEIRVGSVGGASVGGETVYSVDEGVQYVIVATASEVIGYDGNGANGRYVIATKKPTTGSILEASMSFDMYGDIRPGNDKDQKFGTTDKRWQQVNSSAFIGDILTLAPQTPEQVALIPNNTLFVEQATGDLKFKKYNGVVKTIVLGIE